MCFAFINSIWHDFALTIQKNKFESIQATNKLKHYMNIKKKLIYKSETKHLTKCFHFVCKINVQRGIGERGSENSNIGEIFLILFFSLCSVFAQWKRTQNEHKSEGEREMLRG